MGDCTYNLKGVKKKSVTLFSITQAFEQQHYFRLKLFEMPKGTRLGSAFKGMLSTCPGEVSPVIHIGTAVMMIYDSYYFGF